MGLNHMQRVYVELSPPQRNSSNLFNSLKTHHKLQYNECTKAKKYNAVAHVSCLTARQCIHPVGQEAVKSPVTFQLTKE